MILEDYHPPTKDYLKQGILKMSGAKNVWIKENRSGDNIEDIDVQALSVSIFVEGGDLENIYKAIELYRPLGITTNGDVDIQGERFYWVTDINYKEQEVLVKKLNRKLLKESLIKRLAELEEEENV